MYIVFGIVGSNIGKMQWNGVNIAWYLGMIIYWIIWGIIFPIVLVGGTKIIQLFDFKSIGIVPIIILVIPLIFTMIGRLFMKLEQANVKGQMALAGSSIATGVLEEILWRGIFMIMFPHNIIWGFIWPTIWFSIWHLAPGSISVVNKWVLMFGALVFGICWGIVAIQTSTIIWSIISHIGVGLIRIMSKPNKGLAAQPAAATDLANAQRVNAEMRF
jgi:membrane protease YdiL (CAAX protease family)